MIMRVLVACEYSGIVRDAFACRGHDAWSCDMLPTESPGHHYQGDIRDILGDEWDLMIAHPPCTRLTNAGVRWLHKPPTGRTLADMWHELEEGAAFYRELRDADIPHKCIENPIMHKYAIELIKPGHRQFVQPHQFGEPQFKAVGLELINLPDLMPTNKLDVPKKGTPEHTQWSQVHRASPGPDRAKIRSRFFPGIAAAMAEQWSSLS